MQKLVLLSAITCVLCACSEQACDLTGEKYSKMMREGTPLTPKDQACFQANLIRGQEEMIQGFKDAQPKKIPRLSAGR